MFTWMCHDESQAVICFWSCTPRASSNWSHMVCEDSNNSVKVLGRVTWDRTRLYNTIGLLSNHPVVIYIYILYQLYALISVLVPPLCWHQGSLLGSPCLALAPGLRLRAAGALETPRAPGGCRAAAAWRPGESVDGDGGVRRTRAGVGGVRWTAKQWQLGAIGHG